MPVEVWVGVIVIVSVRVWVRVGIRVRVEPLNPPFPSISKPRMWT